MSENKQKESSLSELEIFKRPVVQSDIVNGKFEKAHPITKLGDSGPIEFLIENATYHFQDLRQSYLNIKFMVMKSDGSNLPAEAKAGLVTYPIPSLFQQSGILLNGKRINSSSNIYAYRVILEVLLRYDQGAKNANLAMVLYSKDTATKLDLVAVVVANGGLKASTSKKAKC